MNRHATQKRGAHHAIADFTGHNGKVDNFNPVLQAKCGKGRKGKGHHKRHGGHR